MAYSLLSEPWIKIQNENPRGLLDIFSYPAPKQLGGNPITKISLFKLLLAIAQAACTPNTEKDWEALTPEKVAQKCKDYLKKNENNFNLYDEKKPFLQIPEIASSKFNSIPKPWSAIVPEFVDGNATILMHQNILKNRSDAEKAVDLVCLMSFALGGKKTMANRGIILSPGYKKGVNAKSGPSIGARGFLHAFYQGRNLWETLWLNLWTIERLNREEFQAQFPQGLGRAIWEEMPTGEDDRRAKELKETFIGRLVPLTRFCLIDNEKVHLVEGITYSNEKTNNLEPTAFFRRDEKDEYRALWSDPAKRPWRELESILALKGANRYQNLMLENVTQRISFLKKKSEDFELQLWCGGIKVSSNSGDFYVSGNDDYVESSFSIPMSNFSDHSIELFLTQMKQLKAGADKLRLAVKNYQKELRQEDKGLSDKAVMLYWENTENFAQSLLDSCWNDNLEDIKKLKKKFNQIMFDVYNQYCPYETARQLQAWSQCKPIYISE